jgi:hypothetical protein
MDVYYIEAESDDFPVSAEHHHWYANWSEANSAAVIAARANVSLDTKVTYLFCRT